MKKFILLSLFILTLLPSVSFAAAQSATVNVSGLVCDFCARAVEKVFVNEDSIGSVKVDLNAKTIVLVFKDKQNMDDTKITDLVTKSGYKVVSIVREKDAK